MKDILEIEQLLKLDKIPAFKSTKELYLYLKAEASNTVRNILDHDSNLKENLLYLATEHDRSQYVKGVQILNPADEIKEKLIEVSHLFFYIGGGCGNIHMMLNLNNYASKTDSILYSVFVYSMDGQDADYAEELCENEHLELHIPDNVFFKQLPIFYALSQNESAKEILATLSKRKYSIARYEYVDIKTGKIIQDEY